MQSPAGSIPKAASSINVLDFHIYSYLARWVVLFKPSPVFHVLPPSPVYRGRGWRDHPGISKGNVVELRRKKNGLFSRVLAIGGIIFGPRSIFDPVMAGQRSHFRKFHDFLASQVHISKWYLLCRHETFTSVFSVQFCTQWGVLMHLGWIFMAYSATGGSSRRSFGGGAVVLVEFPQPGYTQHWKLHGFRSPFF